MKRSIIRVISRFMVCLTLIASMQLPSIDLKGEGSDMTDTIRQYSEYMKRADSGWGFTLAVTSDGRVSAWGDNSLNQCNVPQNLDNVIAVSAGGYHSLALKSDGTVVAWGQTDWEQCVVPNTLQDPSTANITAISGGGSHSLALKSNGTVVSWGFNGSGQCTVPADLQDPAKANVIAIAAGSCNSLALKSDGTVVAWGGNSWGECNVPADLKDPASANVVAIAAPWGHCLAIKKDGTAVAWGNNNLHLLEMPGSTSNNGAYYGLSNIVAVSGSCCCSLALKSDGTVAAWGGDTAGEYYSGNYTPPAGLTGVQAISSQAKGCVALKADNTLASWGTTGVTDGTSIIAAPKIYWAQIAQDNSYVDVSINTGVYGNSSHSIPVSVNDFELSFNANGGNAASAAASSITKVDGTPLTGGEKKLRFNISIQGTPSGEETVEIKLPAGHSVYDSSGSAILAGQTTDKVNLVAFAPRIVSAQMESNNSYIDISFNMGVYGDSGHSSKVLPNDFAVTFAQNSGYAAGAAISSIMKTDGLEPQGGETTLRFFLSIAGNPSGDETIEIKPVKDSVFSQSGSPMAETKTTGTVKFSPSVPSIVSTLLASDNSYLDVTFNTGVYGSTTYLDNVQIGESGVTNSNMHISFTKGYGSASNAYQTSIRKPDSTSENDASSLSGGEKTVRIFLKIEGVPTGEEQIAIYVEAVFNAAGQSYHTEVPSNAVNLNARAPGFRLPQLAENNKYIDITFNTGVYGDANHSTPVSASDFKAVINKKSGNTDSITVSSVKKPDGTDKATAHSPEGGETTLRFFLDLSKPATGDETIKITPYDGQSVYSYSGDPMPADRATPETNLRPSCLEVVSAQLADDNSYLDVKFNFGVYGDTAHSTSVTPANFRLGFGAYGGEATDAAISSIGGISGTLGGDTALRFNLNITGIPSGTEKIYIAPSADKPVYDSLGKVMPDKGSQTTGEIALNIPRPVILSAKLGGGGSYVDLNFNVGVYGSSNHSTPVTASSFQLVLNKNGGSVSNAVIRSVKKNDNTDEAKASVLAGGEKTVRVFLSTIGVVSGVETVEIKPANDKSVWNKSGTVMPVNQTSNPIKLSAEALEIVSARLADDNSYIDVIFNTGVFGNNDGSTPVKPDNFRLVTADNGGNVYGGGLIKSVKKADNELEPSATALIGGETTVRFFLNFLIPPTGVETIQIFSNNTDGGPRVCNASGVAMPLSQTTGQIKLCDMRPQIVSAEMSPDSRYMDVHFNTGIYGFHNSLLKAVAAADFDLIFTKNGGGAAGVTISSVKKNNNVSENDASALQGGEETLRFFLNIAGSPSGDETVEIVPKAGCLCDKGKYPLLSGQTTGAVNVKIPVPQVTSAVLGDDNAYIDLTFNTGVYGNSIRSLPVSKSGFTIDFSQNNGTASGVSITSVGKNDNGEELHASPLTGGEKTIRIFLYVSGRADGNETFKIKTVAGVPVFTGNGQSLGDWSSGAIKLISSTPQFVSAKMSEGSKYVDVTFNTGVYGDTGRGPVTIHHFLTQFQSNGGGVSSLNINSVKKPDSEDELSASPLTGGEKTIRFFFSLKGTPTGDETLIILSQPGSSNDKIYSCFYKPMDPYSSTGPVKLIAPSLKFETVSAPQLIGTLDQYIDVTFSTGVYGDNKRGTAVTPSDFQLNFSNAGDGATAADIISVTKPDSTDRAKASSLAGGETTVRFFIHTNYSANGSEIVSINPLALSVFNSSGNAMSDSQKTNTLRLSDSQPGIVSAQMGIGNSYIDINFSMGVYEGTGPVLSQCFSLVFSKNGGRATGVLILKAAKPDSTDMAKASPLTGGETKVRLFLTVGGTPSGVETIEIKPSPGWINNRDGVHTRPGTTTGQIKLFTPYPPSWSNSSSPSEYLGWMSNIMISAGYSHTLIVKNDGTVSAFGDNTRGACDVPSGLSNIKAVSAGCGFSLALKGDGTVAGWGDISVPADLTGAAAISSGSNMAFVLKNDGTVALLGNKYYKYDYINDKSYYVRQLDIPCGSSTVTGISAGPDDHLLVLESNGTVAAFDYNQYTSNHFGQCTVPAGLSNVKAISAGYGFSLALRTDGTVVGWGDITLPASGLSNVAAISAGRYGYSVLKSDGTVEVYDKQGNAENNTKNLNLKGIIAISSGTCHYTAVRENGDVAVWCDEYKFNNLGQLNMPQGLNIFRYILKGTFGYDDGKPYVDLEFTDSSNAAGLGVYGNPSCTYGIDTDDLKVYITKGSQSLFGVSISSMVRIGYSNGFYTPYITGGENKVRVYLKITGIPAGTETIEIKPASSFSIYGGNSSNLYDAQTTGPLVLDKLESQKFLLYEKRMDAGWSHTFSMKEKGVVLDWGDNTYGQAPVPLGQDNASQVSAGYHHSVVLLHDGTVKVWGEDYYGQLKVPNTLKNVIQVSAGGYHTLALKSDGTVVAWGDDFYGQCTVPAGLTGVIKVAAGGHHSLALKSDGTVVAWGDNHFKQCSLPAGLCNVISIAAGEDYSLALKADGTIVAWGDNSKYQLKIPAGLTGVKAISAGYHHSLAVKSDGSVAAWGDNSKGQCNVPAGLNGVVAISAGAYYSIAMKEDGTIAAWGDNSSGQCSIPESAMPPKIISASLSSDNRYVDITFNKGVYSQADGTGPLNTGCLSLIFKSNTDTGGASNVVIKSVKSNNSTEETKASALAGGENIVRVFLTVTGSAAGTETIELKPASGGSVYDMYGASMQNLQTSGALKFSKQEVKLVKDIQIDNSSERLGAVNLVPVMDPNADRPTVLWYLTDPVENAAVIEWEHELKSGADSNRMVLVGLYSRGANHYSQDIWDVYFNGVKMILAGTAAVGDIKLDLYYILDNGLPYKPGKYKIKAFYKGGNTYLEGHAISLCGAAQQGPESVSTATQPDAKAFSAPGTTIKTLTDNAMVVDFAGLYESSIYGTGSCRLSTSINKVKGDVTTSSDSKYGNWADIAVSIRNAAYPADPPAAPATPAPAPTPVIPSGDSIAFEEKGIGFNGNPMQVGNNIAIVGSTQIRMSGDGENWGAAYSHPEGDVFSAGGKLFNFNCSRTAVTINSSSDGINWSNVSCTLPNIIDDSKASYSYEGFTTIQDVAAYTDPTSNVTTYVAIGNAWVAQLNADGSVKTNNGQWNYETSVKIWLTSRDGGATWTANYINDFRFIIDNTTISVYSPRKFQKVICNNNGVFIAYDSQTVYYSADLGSSWTAGRSFTTDGKGAPQNPYYCHITSIFSQNNTLVMTGSGLDPDNINIYWSTDGTVWNDANIAYKDPKFITYDKYARQNVWSYNRSFNNIVYAYNTFAAVSGKTIAASDDGKNWSLYACDYGSYGLWVFNDRFYRAVNFIDSTGYNNWLLSSEDLKNWYVEEKDYRGNGFLYFNGKVYSGSQNGFYPLTVGYVPLSAELEAPKDGDTRVPVSSTLTVSFTDAIKAGAEYVGIVLKDSKGSSVPITVNLDGENKTIGITPKAALNALQGYTLLIPEGALKDISDSKTNKRISIGFTTGISEALTVLGTNLNGIPAASSIEICYSRDIKIDAQVQYDSIKIAPKDSLDNPIAINKTILGNKLTIKPVIPLENSRTYVLTIPDNAIQDTFQNEASKWSTEFTVGRDTVPPVIMSTDPANFGERIRTGIPVRILLGEEVREGDGFSGITLKNIRSESNTDIETKLSTAVGNDGIRRTTLEIIPKTELELHKTYRVYIPANAVKDMAGNAMTGDYSFEFTEEIMKSYPVLLGTNPEDGEKEVDLRGTIVLTYDRPIKAGPNFAQSCIVLHDSVRHSSVDFTYLFKDNKLIITPNITPGDNPYNALAYGVKYELILSGDCISDLYGGMDHNGHKITFTIESCKVISTSPAANSVGAALNSYIALKLDQSLSNAVKGPYFNKILLKRTDMVNSKEVCANVASRAMIDGDELLIIPEEDLHFGSKYTVEIPRGAVCNDSQIVNNYYTFTFIAGTNAKKLSNFSITGGLVIGGALAEGDTVSFDATGCFTGASNFCWNFGDGTTATGANVSHAFAYRGDYNVILAITGTDGNRYVIRKLVSVLKRPDASSILLDVSPQAPVSLNSGGKADLTVTLKCGDRAVKNARIVVTRAYPISENKPQEPLATVITDNNGRASYTATLPAGVPEYYVTFTYNDQYDGVEVKKEVRRILRSAVGKVDVSGYVNDDRNTVQANAKVLIGTKSVTTDSNGFYSITGLDVGTYTMRVSSNMHYDSVTNISLAQKSVVKNVTLTKLSPTGNPVVRQVYVNDTTAGQGKNFYFLQGIDADIEIYALVDWNGHDPGYVEFNHSGTIYNKANMRLKLNAANLKQGDQINITCVTADGIRSAATNARINIIASLPQEFPYTLHPAFIGGKYIIDEYISLTGISTPYITDIPVIEGGPVSFLTQPAHVTGVMNLDGTFHAFIGRSTDISAYGYYSQNNILQKYYAKKNALTDAEKQEISSRQSKSYLGSVDIGGTLDASFYWYYAASLGKWLYKDGTLHLQIDADAYGKSTWGIPGTPLSVYLSGEFGILMDAYLWANCTDGNISYSLGTLDFKKLHLEIAGGADAYIASASVHFSGDGKVRIKYPEKKTDYYIDVKGWVNFKALFWSINIPFLEYDWGDNSPWETQSLVSNYKSFAKASLADSGGSINKTVSGADESMLLPQSTDDFELMGRDYLNEQSDWMPENNSKQDKSSSGGTVKSLSSRLISTADPAAAESSDDSGITTLRSNAYPYTEHDMVPYNDGAFMVLTEDDPARSDTNRTRVEYSIYNGTSWSAPAPIDPDDTTADFRPAAARTDDGVIAVWENVGEVLPLNAQLKEALAKEEICVGRYNSATGKWTDIHNLTSDSYMDCLPRIAASGNKGILVWSKSKSDDYSTVLSSGYSAVNDIMFSGYSGHNFSGPAVIASIDKPIVSSSVAYDGNTGIYVFAVDGDNDLNTPGDQDIYLMSYNGSVWSKPIKLTNNNIKDSNPQVTLLNGKAFIIWDQDGEIVYTADALASSVQVKVALKKTRLQDTFSIAKADGGEIAVVGPGESGKGQELYAAIYDGNGDVWSEEMAITSDNSLDCSASSVLLGNKLITVYNRTQIETATNPADGQVYPSAGNSADLIMAVTELKHDLAASPEGITLSENNPSAGSLLTIRADIENKGTFTEQGFEVAFYDGDPQAGGKQIGPTQVVSGPIAPGATGSASVQWEVPTGAAGRIYIVADPKNGIDDSERSNNTASVGIMQPDIELSALECTPSGAGKYAVKVRISNTGTVDIHGTLISLYYSDSESKLQPVNTINAGELKAGETAELTCLWNPSADIFRDGKTNLFATADITAGEVTESKLENNVQMLEVSRQSLDIISYSPADKEMNFGIDKSISITFNDKIQQGSGYGNILLTGPDGSPIGIKKVISGDTLTITPNQPLRHEQKYTLTLPKASIKGFADNEPASDWGIVFNTEGTATFALVETLSDVSVNGTISLPFSKPISKGSSFDNIACRDSNGQKVPCSFTVQDNLLKIKPDTSLNYSSSYTVTIPENGLRDTGGSIKTCSLNLTTQDNLVQLRSLTLSTGRLNPVFSPQVSCYAVTLSECQANIVVSAEAKVSNSTVTISEGTMVKVLSKTIALNGGTNRIIITVKGEDASVGTYIIDVYNPSKGDDGSQSTQQNAVPAIADSAIIKTGTYQEKIPVITDSAKGVITVSLNEGILSKAFENTEAGSDGIKTVSLTVPGTQGADSYALQVPAAFLASDNTSGRIKMISDAGTVTIPLNMLKGISLGNVANASISIGKANKPGLPGYVQDIVGSRPVIDLRLMAQDSTIAWNNPDAAVTVSIPYTPSEEELADSEHITVWCIDAAGKVTPVISGRYDSKTGTVTFTTTHFSLYAAAFVQKTFDDLGSAAWAKKSVETLASKGVFQGTSEKKFSPMKNITRAEFLYSLIKTLGVETKFDGNFDDVKKDSYYYREIGIAKKLGITTGTGNNKFSPDAGITRQDMIVMAERALRLLKKIKQNGAAPDLRKFADRSAISSYAVNSIASAVKEGLIEGSGNRINPGGNTTRAEAAVFLYRIYSRY